MNSYFQLLALFFHFFYGIIIAFLIRIFYHLFNKLPFLPFLLLLIVLNLDMLGIYFSIIYDVFNGIFNGWYIVFFLGGIINYVFFTNRRKLRVNG